MDSTPQPEQDPLQAVRRAFAATDFGTARRLLLHLRKNTQDPVVRAEIEPYLDRLRPDPLVIALCVGCFLLFLVMLGTVLRK